jgi:hypothetical protein
MRHPAVLSAIKNLKDSIENGSFAKITEAYKKMDDDLTTQVNQARKFRNWVAHGRRDEPENITPARKFRMLLHINPTRQRGKRTGSLAGASGWYMTFFAAGVIVWTQKPRKAGSSSTSSGWPSLKRPEKCPRQSRSRVRRSNAP